MVNPRKAVEILYKKSGASIRPSSAVRGQRNRKQDRKKANNTSGYDRFRSRKPPKNPREFTTKTKTPKIDTLYSKVTIPHQSEDRASFHPKDFPNVRSPTSKRSNSRLSRPKSPKPHPPISQSPTSRSHKPRSVEPRSKSVEKEHSLHIIKSEKRINRAPHLLSRSKFVLSSRQAGSNSSLVVNISRKRIKNHRVRGQSPTTLRNDRLKQFFLKSGDTRQSYYLSALKDKASNANDTKANKIKKEKIKRKSTELKTWRQSRSKSMDRAWTGSGSVLDLRRSRSRNRSTPSSQQSTRFVEAGVERKRLQHKNSQDKNSDLDFYYENNTRFGERNPDIFRNVLGPTPDETILAGLQTVIDMCSVAETLSAKPTTESSSNVITQNKEIIDWVESEFSSLEQDQRSTHSQASLENIQQRKKTLQKIEMLVKQKNDLDEMARDFRMQEDVKADYSLPSSESRTEDDKAQYQSDSVPSTNYTLSSSSSEKQHTEPKKRTAPSSTTFVQTSSTRNSSTESRFTEKETSYTCSPDRSATVRKTSYTSSPHRSPTNTSSPCQSPTEKETSYTSSPHRSPIDTSPRRNTLIENTDRARSPNPIVQRMEIKSPQYPSQSIRMSIDDLSPSSGSSFDTYSKSCQTSLKPLVSEESVQTALYESQDATISATHTTSTKSAQTSLEPLLSDVAIQTSGVDTPICKLPVTTRSLESINISLQTSANHLISNRAVQANKKIFNLRDKSVQTASSKQPTRKMLKKNEELYNRSIYTQTSLSIAKSVDNLHTLDMEGGLRFMEPRGTGEYEVYQASSLYESTPKSPLTSSKAVSHKLIADKLESIQEESLTNPIQTLPTPESSGDTISQQQPMAHMIIVKNAPSARTHRLSYVISVTDNRPKVSKAYFEADDDQIPLDKKYWKYPANQTKKTIPVNDFNEDILQEENITYSQKNQPNQGKGRSIIIRVPSLERFQVNSPNEEAQENDTKYTMKHSSNALQKERDIHQELTMLPISSRRPISPKIEAEKRESVLDEPFIRSSPRTSGKTVPTSGKFNIDREYERPYREENRIRSHRNLKRFITDEDRVGKDMSYLEKASNTNARDVLRETLVPRDKSPSTSARRYYYDEDDVRSPPRASRKIISEQEPSTIKRETNNDNFRSFSIPSRRSQETNTYRMEDETPHYKTVAAVQEPDIMRREESNNKTAPTTAKVLKKRLSQVTGMDIDREENEVRLRSPARSPKKIDKEDYDEKCMVSRRLHEEPQLNKQVDAKVLTAQDSATIDKERFHEKLSGQLSKKSPSRTSRSKIISDSDTNRAEKTSRNLQATSEDISRGRISQASADYRSVDDTTRCKISRTSTESRVFVENVVTQTSEDSRIYEDLVRISQGSTEPEGFEESAIFDGIARGRITPASGVSRVFEKVSSDEVILKFPSKDLHKAVREPKRHRDTEREPTREDSRKFHKIAARSSSLQPIIEKPLSENLMEDSNGEENILGSTLGSTTSSQRMSKASDDVQQQPVKDVQLDTPPAEPFSINTGARNALLSFPALKKLGGKSSKNRANRKEGSKVKDKKRSSHRITRHPNKCNCGNPNCECFKSIQPREVRYATVRITKFEYYSTFEILSSTRRKPKFIPSTIESIFVVKNK